LVIVDDCWGDPGCEAAGDEQGGGSEGRLRVLVVDDNVDAANSLAMLLALTDGHDVRVAYDGLAALEVAQVHRPDVLLLDLGMPGLNGFEVARKLRAQTEFARSLIVALTGWGMERDRIRTRESGFDQHLVKPVEPDTIRELLAQFGQGRGGSSSADEDP
jgi:two-component system CheB/CheR fusion protein